MIKPTKKQIIITLGTVLFIVGFILTGAGEKLGRLAVVSQNIATNIIHATHGDPRPLEQMTAVYIKANTGSTNIVDVKSLPRALTPFKEFTHPPFKMGACAVCHAPNRSKPAAIVTHTVAQLCYKCHEPVGGIGKDAHNIDCNKCHSPHHADKEKLLRNDVTATRCPAGTFDAEGTLPNMEHNEH
jgi:predicted CXXCH cytochrome family protein